MFKFFSKYKSLSEKAQISIFFIAIMTVMIVITFITINIGKIAKDKTYSGNAADGGALAGASVSAYAFNYVANANKSDKGKYLENNWNDFEKIFNDHFDWAMDIYYEDYTPASDEAQKQSCCTPVAGTASDKANEAANHADRYSKQMNELIKGAYPKSNPEHDQIQGTEPGVIPNYAKLQEDFYIAIRERVHDDEDGQNDLYQNALYAGYIFNLQNDGTSHRLGKINQKRWSAFLQGITPQTVRNGKPETFSYVDGAGRFHIVTAIVNIQAMRTFELITTEIDRAQVKENLESAKQKAKVADVLATLASVAYKGARLCAGCCWFCPPCCSLIAKPVGDKFMGWADGLMEDADKLAEKTRSGLIADGKKTSTSKNDTNGNIIKYIEDITHDRMVNSSDFQFHMGGPIKGMRGDVDVPNFYPPIQSNATAFFKGQGSIHPQKPNHEAKLITAN